MAAAVDRLRRRPDFLLVAATRRRWVTPGLIVQIRRRGDDQGLDAAAGRQTLRVGLTVSRKVGGAVVRNRAKRRLRAVVNEVMPRHAEPGHDYVLIGRAETVRRPYGELLGDLTEALRRLKVYRDGNGRDGNEAGA